MRSIATFSARSSAEFSPWQAGRLPLGRDALRLLLPASTPSDPSRAPDPKNCPAQRSRAARLGDSFYFAKCEIVKSLLRRGAQVELSRRAGTALPRGAACPRWAGKTSFCWGLTDEKTAFVRAPGEIISDKLIVYRFDFLLRRGARGLRELRSRAGPRARGERAKLRFAWAIRARKRALSARWRKSIKQPRVV